MILDHTDPITFTLTSEVDSAGSIDRRFKIDLKTVYEQSSAEPWVERALAAAESEGLTFTTPSQRSAVLWHVRKALQWSVPTGGTGRAMIHRLTFTVFGFAPRRLHLHVKMSPDMVTGKAPPQPGKCLCSYSGNDWRLSFGPRGALSAFRKKKRGKGTVRVTGWQAFYDGHEDGYAFLTRGDLGLIAEPVNAD